MSESQHDTESRDPAQLGAEAREIIAEEEALHAAVQRALLDRGGRPPRLGLGRRIDSLRDEMDDTRIEDVPTLVSEAQRVRETERLVSQSVLPDPSSPYFAHMKLETPRGVRDVLLGGRSFIETKSGVTIVDWRDAPIAQVFFHYEEGDEYEQDLPGRIIEGKLQARRVVAFDQGELVQIQTPREVLRRERGGAWQRDVAATRPRLSGGEGGALAERLIGTGRSGEKLPVVSALLDARQYEALTMDPEAPLLILGGAGCGKTTVALHRVAHLAYEQSERFDRRRVAVIVPEEGLVRLTRTLLEELGMQEIRVTTVDAWFTSRARSLLSGLPKRLASNTPAAVMRMKRHPALAECLPALAEESARRCARAIDRHFGSEGAFETAYERAEGDWPMRRLEAARQAVSPSTAQEDDFEKICDEAFERFVSFEDDRERLFGDRALLAEVVERAGGELTPRMADRTVIHTRIQLAAPAEEMYAGIDASRLRTADGRLIDSGTPDEDAGAIDVEDFALLLELRYLKTGETVAANRPGARYVHLVLDEAQELSEVELRVLGQTVADHGSVTVAGDSAQQIGIGSCFRSWEATMEALGCGAAAPVVLETSYRCTAPILELAHHVLGPLAPAVKPRATRDGAPVSHSFAASEMHLAILLGEALSDLLDREPNAQVAIISREDDRARDLYHTLEQQLPVRLVLDGRFTFEPGIDITSVAQVKGLEFEYVVIPDANADTYPADPASRRMLHVASTRAIHQLWLLAEGPFSTLLPEA
jgi:DNA helicase-2/ATP-dependent DNA helicase PcrA